MDVPVQFFQSTIAIELAVAGALPWEVRFFESPREAARERRDLPDPRLRLLLALVLAATIFGSLWGIAEGGGVLAASAVTVGVAVSPLPILIRVLPPLARDAATHERDPGYSVTLVGLFLYVAAIAGVIALINID